MASTESLCCTPQINMILQINDTSIKNIFKFKASGKSWGTSEPVVDAAVPFQAPLTLVTHFSTVHISSSCLFLRTALSQKGAHFPCGDCAPTFSFSTSFLHAVLLFLWMMIHSVDPWAFSFCTLVSPSPIHCLFYKLNLLFILPWLFQSTSVVDALFSYYSCKYPKGQNLDSFFFLPPGT